VSNRGWMLEIELCRRVRRRLRVVVSVGAAASYSIAIRRFGSNLTELVGGQHRSVVSLLLKRPSLDPPVVQKILTVQSCFLGLAPISLVLLQISPYTLYSSYLHRFKSVLAFLYPRVRLDE
jgi:hypothetical protein